MTTVVSIVMSDIVPLRERGVWQGIINIVYATGAGVGAPLGECKELTFPRDFVPLVANPYRIGGILADYIGWRWYE